MFEVNLPAPPPYVGARVRWHSSLGTYFGRVATINKEAQTLVVQLENSTFVRTIDINAAALLSAPEKEKER